MIPDAAWCWGVPGARAVSDTVWTVEWTQQIYLGEVEWLWPNEPPGTLHLNVDGCTGTGNEDHYFRPEDLAWDTPALNTTG